MKYVPKIYQQHAEEHVMQNPAAALLKDMGLGKTIVTLTCIDKLMFDEMSISKTLVIAPKKVAEHTWTSEIEKWDHTRHLRVSKILGNAKQRLAALKVKADIYIINRENIVWLIAHLGGAWPFDFVVIDELSSFKSAKSARFKALRKVAPRAKRVLGLTGTPMPNGLLDLWPQMYLLDQGQRLGNTLTVYRERYFSPPKYQHGEYTLRKVEDDLLGENFYEKLIYEKISDICISMKKEDWLELPPRVDRDVDVRLSGATLDQYYAFEREMILKLEEEQISAVNAAALTNKLLQFANGAIYSEDGKYTEVHNEKIEALGELVEQANGHPILVFYQYKHDVERIMRHLKHLKPYKLNGSGDIDRWNRKEITFALGHAASFGHGLNMQDGGNLMAWFGKPWSLELYLQAIARLDRQGQSQSVFNFGLKAIGTMDEDVYESLALKDGRQERMLQAVKARVQKYRN